MAKLIQGKIYTATPFAGSGANETGLYYLPNVVSIGRAPNASDTGQLGQIIRNETDNSLWILSSVAVPMVSANVWTQFAGSSAETGNFTTLTATGATNLNNGTANPVNILSSGTGPIVIGNATGGAASFNSGTLLNIGQSATLTAINIADIVPTVSRLTTINGGTVGSAINDLIDIGGDGVNFAGSNKIVSISGGDALAGTNGVNIADGNVGATGNNAVGILTGNVTPGGVSGIAIATGTGVKSIIIGNDTDLLTTFGFAGKIGFQTPAVTAANSGIGFACGAAPTVRILAGTGNPTGATLAPQGSLYIQTDAAAATERLWIATAANTWTFFTSAA